MWYYIQVRWRGVAQFGSALGSGLRGRRFKSCRPDHILHIGCWSREHQKLNNGKQCVSHGELSERLKEHDWKSCIGLKLYRGFKSHALRHNEKRICFGRFFFCTWFFLTAADKPAILTFVENKAEAIRFSPYMAFVLLRFMRNQSSG